jgi:hypothetical protein
LSAEVADATAAAPRRPPVPVRAYPIVLAAVVLAAYAGDVGQAFIKEDAIWILRSRIAGVGDVTRLVTDTGGFFRPVVALSFAVNYWMFGSGSSGYGWTNLLLASGCAAALWRLARVLGLPRGAAVLAAAVWILNFHGISMAVLWLSGRTALLLVLFSLLAATAAARARVVSTCVYCLLAMASKEEGVLLPIVLIAVAVLRPEGAPPRKRLTALVAGLLIVWLTYGGLRTASDAYTPTTAPPFYTFTAAPSHVWDNIVEYADRALTLAAAVTLLALAIGGRRVSMGSREWKLVGLAGVWLAAGCGLTIFLPARSSLYALLPSVGGALASATVIGAAWSDIPPRRQRALAYLALVLPLSFVPIDWQRNERWTELADVSAQTVATFAALAPAASSRWEVIVLDDRSTRANVAAALGWGLPGTVELVTGKRPRVWIVPPPPDIDPSDIVMSPAAAGSILELRDGRVVPAPVDRVKPTPAGQFW